MSYQSKHFGQRVRLFMEDIDKCPSEKLEELKEFITEKNIKCTAQVKNYLNKIIKDHLKNVKNL
mgnify:CR=1 FL=1